MGLMLKRLMVGVIGTNCYLAANEDTKEGFILDPGGDAQRIAREVRRMEMHPQAILLTHGHADHISGISELEKQIQVPVWALDREKAVLHDTEANLTAEFGGGQGFTLDASRYLTDGEQFVLAGVKIRVIWTPGHTAGSCCYYLPEAGVLFSGDTLFAQSYGRTDMPTGSEREMVHSVRDILLRLPAATKVFPGHMGFTTIADERAGNPLSAGNYPEDSARADGEAEA